MSEEQQSRRVSSWCYGVRKQVWVYGVLVGRRQADLLRVLDCEEKACSMRGTESCLIGKLREGRWNTT